MLFKPDHNEAATTGRVARVAGRARRRTVSIFITLLILGGLGYIGWTSFQQKQAASRNARPDLAELESTLLDRVNALGIGPQGLGGRVTALAVNIEVLPTHIAGLPVAVNLGCHSTRRMTVEL